MELPFDFVNNNRLFIPDFIEKLKNLSSLLLDAAYILILSVTSRWYTKKLSRKRDSRRSAKGCLYLSLVP